MGSWRPENLNHNNDSRGAGKLYRYYWLGLNRMPLLYALSLDALIYW